MTTTKIQETWAKSRSKRANTLKKRITFHERSISPSLLAKEAAERNIAELKLDILSSQPTSTNVFVRFVQSSYFGALNSRRETKIRSYKALLDDNSFEYGIELEKARTVNATAILKSELAHVS